MGRILVPAGLLVALTGLWMSVFHRLPATDGRLLGVIRLIVGPVMLYGIAGWLINAVVAEWIIHPV